MFLLRLLRASLLAGYVFTTAFPAGPDILSELSTSSTGLYTPTTDIKQFKALSLDEQITDLYHQNSIEGYVLYREKLNAFLETGMSKNREELSAKDPAIADALNDLEVTDKQKPWIWRNVVAQEDEVIAAVKDWKRGQILAQAATREAAHEVEGGEEYDDDRKADLNEGERAPGHILLE